ncbi:hypothetical protein LQ318_05285 [Aliifodinibius salicampi]|uniref:Uncharacterized protein n=1 Tax=Fodinibius salicampi TaxID=1920655 RepID=A0ABT3PWT2_9BACT|nr:hypothetical protein [Fodinibius salicampi]MCW9712315.1 hypothetical protein [Fodinibius salicampi]
MFPTHAAIIGNGTAARQASGMVGWLRVRERNSHALLPGRSGTGKTGDRNVSWRYG